MQQNGFDRTIWVKESSPPAIPIDTVIFDVDGVLWDTGDSFDTAVQQTVEYFLRHRFGRENERPVTTEQRLGHDLHAAGDAPGWT